MEYVIDYQYLPEGASRPVDEGEIITIRATDERGLVILPHVGDYVSVDNSMDEGQRLDFPIGKVKSRLFRYIRKSDNTVFCHVNIVVGATQDDTGRLVKE